MPRLPAFAFTDFTNTDDRSGAAAGRRPGWRRALALAGAVALLAGGAGPARADLVKLAFPGAAPSGLRLESGGQVARIDHTSGTSLPPARLSSALGEVFSLTLWFRVNPGSDWDQPGWREDRPHTLLVLQSSDGQERLAVRLPDGNVELGTLARGAGTDWHTMRSTDRIDAGRWYALAVVREGEKATIYLNGKRVAAHPASPRMTSLEQVTFGRFDGRRRYDGGLIEPRFHDVALTEAEVQKIARQAPSEARSGLGELRGAAYQGSFGRYEALMVSPGDLHPLIDQLHVSATVAPWSRAGSPDVLVRSLHSNFLGARLAHFTPQGRDDDGLPFYDTGKTLADIPGSQHAAVLRADGKNFDLFAKGEGTPFGRNALVQLINTGRPGAPEFASPRIVLVDGKPSDAALARLNGWAVGDIDGDGVPDLLVSINRSTPSDGAYWPDGQQMWGGVERANSGPGKGYDIQDRWLGGESTSELQWARGRAGAGGALDFAAPRPVFYRQKGFSVQWKGAGSAALRALRLEGRLTILHTGEVDRLLALPAELVDGDLICSTAVPLLESGPSVKGTYLIHSISILDTKPDGSTRLLLDGNPGRLHVVEGRRIGGFREVGPLKMKGGPLAVDTLATPARVDWDGDKRPDLVVGDASGYLTFWAGTDDPLVYRAGRPFLSEGREVHHQAGLSGSIQGPVERRWGYLQPTVGGWDADNAPSVIIANDIRGELTLYRRGSGLLDLQAPRKFTLKGQPYRVAWRARPAIVPAGANVFGLGIPVLLHMDWDGDLAIGVPDRAGSTDFREIIKLRHEDGSAVRLSGPGGLWGRGELSVSDWLGNGRWQVVFGTNKGVLPYATDEKLEGTTPLLLENTGTSREPRFKRARAIRLASGEAINLDMHCASAWPTDLDGDGRLDLIVGAEDGKIYRFFRKELTPQP